MLLMEPQPRSRPGRLRPPSGTHRQSASKHVQESRPAAIGRRPVELWVAVIGMIGVLAGAFVGGVVTGGYSLATAERQISADNERSVNEFLRPQRQEAYAKFILSEETLSRAEGDFSDAIKPEILITDASKLFDLITRVNAAYDVFREDYARVKLVGSAKAVDVARDIEVEHYSIVSGARDAEENISSDVSARNSERHRAYRSSVIEDISGTAGAIYDLNKLFLVEARENIGTR